MATDSLFGAVMSYCENKACKSGSFYYHFEENVGKYCAGAAYVKSEKTKHGRITLIESMVKDAGLPVSISVLSIVESGLDPFVRSSVDAVGIWQFKADTATDMGLIVDSKVDERTDVKASTKAAIKYLNWLSTQFGNDLDLSIIAYNAGVGKVSRLIDKYGVSNPWLIAKGLMKGKEAEHYLAKYYGYSLAMYAEGVCDENKIL